MQRKTSGSLVAAKQKTNKIHWLTGTALHQAQKLYHQQHHVSENTRLADTLAEYPDLLFEITETGAIGIWGVQGLGKSPHRIAKVSYVPYLRLI